MKDYRIVYQKLSAPCRRYPILLFFVRFLNATITKLMVVVYLVLLLSLQSQGKSLLVYLVIPALAFNGLSAFRKLLDRPRPYDMWEIDPLITKEKSGQSMPSRHVFSATLISMCLFTVTSFWGSVCLILAVILAICRVVGGVHYPSDVVMGYLIGILVGAFLWLL